jgi:hypothetical protein
MINLAPKTKKYLKLAGKILLLLIVVGSLAWFFIINPYLIRQEKQRFESATAELEKLSQQIQAKIGQSGSVVEDNSCDRPNLKSEKGPLSCDVGYELTYSEVSAEEAFTRIGIVKDISQKPLRIGSVNMKSLTFLENSERQTIFQDLSLDTDHSCFVSYSYDVNVFSILLSCGGPARAEHYPVED